MSYESSLSIKTWAEEDRPREKFAIQGKSALTDAELIAILISSGNREESAVELSKRILVSVSNNLNELGKVNLADLMKFKGIGEAKAISIAAALELGRRRKGSEVLKRIKINTSYKAFEQLTAELSDLKHEEFWVLILDRQNKILEKKCISSGGVTATIADAKLIFKPAIEKLASGIILFHNHPSGALKPSEQDIQLTKNLKITGKTLDIPILDHLIIANNKYFSFADEGYM